jgi:hypothetical protein
MNHQSQLPLWKALRRFIAKRRLARLVRQERARNFSWSMNRAAQLDGERRKRFLATFDGVR